MPNKKKKQVKSKNKLISKSLSRKIKSRAENFGLAPGVLPESSSEELRGVALPRITLISYDSNSIESKELKNKESLVSTLKDLIKDKEKHCWINIDAVNNIELIKELASIFDLHPLILEDLVNTHQRPKLEDWDEHLYLVLRMLSYKDKLIDEQISLILGPNYLISFQEYEGDVFDAVRNRLLKNKGRVRKGAADYLAHCLIDITIDHYFLALSELSEGAEVLEQGLLEKPSPQKLSELYSLRQKLSLIKKYTLSTKELVNGLLKSESSLVQDSTEIYLRNLLDHCSGLIDSAEMLNEFINSSIDLYHSNLSTKTNEIMKVLTLIATIFMPLTFIAGIYGMNFKFMPELEWQYGYPLILGIMLIIGAIMMIYFRSKKWL